MGRLEIECSATTANLGPGFDTLGLALNRANTFLIEEAEEFELSAEGVEAALVPREPERHAVVKAYQATRAALGLPPSRGLKVHAQVWVPPSRGLGSSATATAAGILAAEAHATTSLGDAGSLGEAARLELASSLEGHPDNVVPCLLGGLCVAARSGAGRLVVERFELPNPPGLVAVIPRAVELSTATMRQALPASVPYADAVANLGALALLVGALVSGRAGPLTTALADRLHEPYRGPHIPGFSPVKAAGLAAGAHGVVISGSGPTLLALTPPALRGAVGAAMVAAWEAAGVQASAHELEVELRGARLR